MGAIKTIGKTALCLSVAIAVLFSLVGCSKTYRADYLKKYSEYLDYALGKNNWILVDSSQEKVEFADFIYYYTWWSVEYVDSQGDRRSLDFNNYTGATPDDIHFSNAVIRAAAEISRDRIEAEITPLYGTIGTKPSLVVTVSSYPLFSEQNTDLSNGNPVISPKDGLSLYDYNTAWVFEGHRFYLEVTGSFEDEELYARAISTLYSEVKDFVKTDLDVFIDLTLLKKGTGMVIDSRQIAYLNGKMLSILPGEGQKAKFWFEELLRGMYFPKEN